MGNNWHEAGVKIAAHEAALRLAALTPRERDILDGIVHGNTNKQIAYILGISARTVENHRAHMMRCLGARHVADVIRLVLAVGS